MNYNFNLLPWRQNLLKERIYKKINLGAYISLMVAILLISYQIIITKEISNLTQQKELLQKKFLEVKEQYDFSQNIQNKKQLLLQKIYLINSIENKEINQIEILVTLSKIIPPSFYLTKITLQKNSLIISGKTNKPENIEILVKNLLALTYLSEPKITIQKNPSEIAPVINSSCDFSLELKIKNDQDIQKLSN